MTRKGSDELRSVGGWMQRMEERGLRSTTDLGHPMRTRVQLNMLI